MLFAGLDEHDVVYQLIDVPDSVSTDPLAYIVNDLGLAGVWVNAMIDNSSKSRFCGIGYIYVREIDRFIPPKPFNSWVLSSDYIWVPPISHPGDGLYTWNETDQSWLPVEIS